MNSPEELTPDHQIVRLKDLKVDMAIGINDWERAPGKTQLVAFNIELHAALPKSKPKDISDCIDYRRVVDYVQDRYQDGVHVDLIEEIAYDLIDFCLSDDKVLAARVAVSKPHVYNGVVVPEVEYFRSKR